MGKAGYTYLTTFRLSEVIHQLTKTFLKKYLPGQENLRQRTQMDQAARSGKQNIAEGYSQGTSLKGYIKLLGIAKGSLEELRLDYEDFLKERKLGIWGKDNPKVRDFREFRVKKVGEKGGEDLYNVPELSSDPEEASNYLITLISLNTFLLERQIKSLLEKHAREGGFTEKLYQRRTEYREKELGK